MLISCIKITVIRGFNKHRRPTKSVVYFDQRTFCLDWSNWGRILSNKIKIYFDGVGCTFYLNFEIKVTPHCAFGMIWYRCYGSTHVFIHNLMPRMLEIRFQSFQISKFFGGGMPPDPPTKRGLVAPCLYHCLLFSSWLPASNFIETLVLLNKHWDKLIKRLLP